MARLERLIGRQFDRLTVRGGPRYSGHNPPRAHWFAECDCGEWGWFRASRLKGGTTKSCGCLQREESARRNVKQFSRHGHARQSGRSRTYTTWQMLRQRCTNPRNPNYRWYGGRGITVCERWLHNFENFLADMGHRPTGKSIDRINSNGDYEPSNCRWATPSEQLRNRRAARLPKA
jgi:hypothetical protein